MKINLIIAFLFCLSASVNYKVDDKSSVVIKGTSTLHDWEMKTSNVSGTANFELDNTEISGIKSLTISVPSESLKSDKSAMDKNAYKALKTSDHKNINFKMTKINRFEKVGDDYRITCDGTLEIAGSSKPTVVIAMCSLLNTGVVHCTGEKTIKMSEYKVEAPSFMFGSVKTGDEITIVFDVNLNKI